MTAATERPDAIRLAQIIVDCHDPERLAHFWSELLVVAVGEPYLFLRTLPNGIRLGFQAVPEPKVAKSRLHLDVRTRNLEAAFARVLALGGQHLADVEWWRVMADPEGNEFCVLAPLPPGPA